MSKSPAGAAPSPYHHGDLRRALIKAALDEIAVNGPGHLSLRAIARSAGVSHAAPAHHFGDKRGVFTAIAAEGFDLLYQSQVQASHGLAPDSTLLPLAFNYIRFAIDHPSHFAVMWRQDLYDQEDPELLEAKARVFDVFYRSVAADLPTDDFEAAVTAAWSVVHGFATLWLSGNLTELMGEDPDAAALRGTAGLIAIAEVAARQLHQRETALKRPRRIRNERRPQRHP